MKKVLYVTNRNCPPQNTDKKYFVFKVVLSILICLVMISFPLLKNGLKKVEIVGRIEESDNDIDFNTYSNQLTSIVSEYGKGDDEIVFHVEEDLSVVEGDFYVDNLTFAKFTGAETTKVADNKFCISKNEWVFDLNTSKLKKTQQLSVDCFEANQKICFPLKEVAKVLGYSIEASDDEIVLSRPYSSKRLIVESSVPLNDCGAIAKTISYQGMQIFQYATEQEALSALEYFKALDEVKYVFFDEIVTIDEDENINTQILENESSNHLSWGASYLGVDNYYTYLNNEIGINELDDVIVAVLDTGIYANHLLFDNRIAEGGKNFSSSIVTSVTEDDTSTGHGTHVAGIIADLTKSNVKILPIKVFDSKQSTSNSLIYVAIEYVINLKTNNPNLHICAMNMSFGSDDTSDTSPSHAKYKELIDMAKGKRILSVVAAGNNGNKTDKSPDVANISPANVDTAITVASVQKDSSTSLSHSSFSNYGRYIDVCAPGSEIKSAGKTTRTSTAIKSGTSMAAPHVSALIAILSSNSIANYSSSEIESGLYNYTIKVASGQWTSEYGYGLVCLNNFPQIMDVAEVEFSVTERNFSSDFNLTLSSSTKGAIILYTLNGSEPNIDNLTSTFTYNKAIKISKSTIVKAKAYVILENSNWVEELAIFSETVTNVYSLNNTDIENPFQIVDNTLIKYKGILDSVTLPDNIIDIGANAFETDYSILKKISGNGIVHFDNDAFTECVSAFEMYFPNLTDIDENTVVPRNTIMYLTKDIADDNNNFYIPEGVIVYGKENSNIQVKALEYGNEFRPLVAPQWRTDLPDSKEATYGSEFTLTVEAEGTMLSYSWYVKKYNESNYSLIEGATNSNLVLTQVLDISADYYAKAIDQSGDSITSNICTVKAMQYCWIVYYRESLSSTDIQHNGNYYEDLKSKSKQQKSFEIGSTPLIQVDDLSGFTCEISQNVISSDANNNFIYVYYNRNIYTVTLKKENGISSVSGAGNYKYGQIVNIEAEMMSGYYFGYWETSQSKLYNVEQQFEMPDYDIELTARVKQQTYTITLEPNDNVNYIMDGGNTVEHGESKTYYFQAHKNWHITDVIIDNESQGQISEYTFTNVISPHTIKIKVAKNVYTVKILPSENGRLVSDVDIFQVIGGDYLRLEIDADSWYMIDYIEVNGTKMSAHRGYFEINEVSDNLQICAKFKKWQFLGLPTTTWAVIAGALILCACVAGCVVIISKNRRNAMEKRAYNSLAELDKAEQFETKIDGRPNENTGSIFGEISGHTSFSGNYNKKHK